MTTGLDNRAASARAITWIRRVQIASVVTWGLLATVVIVNALVQPTFFTLYSITSTFATFVPLVFAAVAQAIVVIGGGLDLSIGTIVALSSVVALKVMNGSDALIGLGLLAALATGALCGLINGILVAVVRLQPLIVTFATASVFGGLTLVVLPSPGGSVPPAMTQGFRLAFIGIPIPVWCVLLAVGIWLVLARTRFLRHVYAVGGDASAAFASLVPVVRVRMLTYVVAGALGGVAALGVLANTGSGDPFIGADIALDSIAAVVLGGIALRGGRGGAIGAIAGAIILALVTNVLFFLNVPTTFRELASGLVIIAALALSVLTTRKGVVR